MKETTLERLREICLSLPEATEGAGVAEVTFRVRGKIFVMYHDDHHGDGRLAIWCKAAHGEQEALVASDPERYFVPPYVGPRGWIGYRLDVRQPDWEEVRGLAEESYRLIAPRSLARLLDATGG